MREKKSYTAKHRTRIMKFSISFNQTAYLYINVNVLKEHICNNQCGGFGGLYIFYLAKRYVNLNIRNCTLYISYKKVERFAKIRFSVRQNTENVYQKNIKKRTKLKFSLIFDFE
jgi:hypothetical protein